jgi:putative ABC transport system permease protein
MIDELRTLAKFYRRHLRVQPLRELMAIAGVAAGVALLFSVQVAHRSIVGSFEEVAHGVAGHATLELAARSPEGFDERIATEIQRMPGVAAAAPLLSVPIRAAGPHGERALTLVGADERVLALHGRLSTAFQRAAESTQRGLLLLSSPTAQAIGVGVGGHMNHRVTVLLAGHSEHMTLDATLGSSAIGAAAQSPIAAAPLAIVQNMAGLSGRVTRVLIEPARGAEAKVRGALAARYGSKLNPRPIDTEAQLLAGVAFAERQVTLLFSVISLVAGIVLAYNALLLASAERRRFILELVKEGAPDSMVIGSLAFDATVLGLAGCVLGLLAGEIVSLYAYHGVPGYIAAAFAVGSQHIVTAQTVLIALGGGILAAFAATLLPALGILRAAASAQPEGLGRTLSLTRTLRPSERAVFACGAVLVCGCTITALLAPATTVVALVGLAAGLVICLPLCARGLLTLAGAAARRSGDAAARLSVVELSNSPSRSVALLATGTIAAFLMIVIGGSVKDVQGAVRAGAGDLLSSAQIWVKPGGAENVYTTEPFQSAALQARLSHLPGVSSVLPWRDSFLDLSGRRVWVLGTPPGLGAQIVGSQLLEGNLRSADARLREGGWAAVSQTIAREHHLHLGERFSLPTPAGYASFRLAATTANYGWLSGAIVMNGAEHARLWGSSSSTQLAVTLNPGASIPTTKTLIEHSLPPGAALAVKSSSERQDEVSAVLGSTLSRLDEITIVVLITTIASVIALMMSAVWQGRARFNSLISIGMGATQFAQLIFYETGITLLGGCVIGVLAGLLGQEEIDGWLARTTGSPVHYSPAWELGLLTLAIALAISLTAALIAVLRINATQPRAAFSMQ